MLQKALQPDPGDKLAREKFDYEKSKDKIEQAHKRITEDNKVKTNIIKVIADVEKNKAKLSKEATEGYAAMYPERLKVEEYSKPGVRGWLGQKEHRVIPKNPSDITMMNDPMIQALIKAGASEEDIQTYWQEKQKESGVK